jgi:hypothetical protein
MHVNGFSPIMLFGREYSSGHELEAPHPPRPCARPASGPRDWGGGGARPNEQDIEVICRVRYHNDLCLPIPTYITNAIRLNPKSTSACLVNQP